ncbi:unnamed protein product, partial [Amoebophrya sp. A25]
VATTTRVAGHGNLLEDPLLERSTRTSSASYLPTSRLPTQIVVEEVVDYKNEARHLQHLHDHEDGYDNQPLQPQNDTGNRSLIHELLSRSMEELEAR